MSLHWPEPQVFLAWDLRAKRVEAVQDAYRVVTSEGEFCLKRASGPSQRLETIAEALDYLERRGFRQLTPFFLTRDGRPYVQQGGHYFYLTQWLPGERPDLSRPEMAVAAVECLAAFHLASEGFVDQRGALRQHLGKWPDQLARRARELRDLYCDRALEGGSDRFTRLFVASAERWVPMADWAVDLLAYSGYPEEVAEFRARGGFCHGDPAERNFIWWRDQPYLIDFDTLLHDLPVLDLARLIRRVDQDCQWSQELGDAMVDAYHRLRPLNHRECTLLLVLLAFPEKYWRAVHRYYRDREGKSPRHLLHRLQEVEETWVSLNRFLAHLAERMAVPLHRPLPEA